MHISSTVFCEDGFHCIEWLVDRWHSSDRDYASPIVDFMVWERRFKLRFVFWINKAEHFLDISNLFDQQSDVQSLDYLQMKSRKRDRCMGIFIEWNKKVRSFSCRGCRAGELLGAGSWRCTVIIGCLSQAYTPSVQLCPKDSRTSLLVIIL